MPGNKAAMKWSEGLLSTFNTAQVISECTVLSEILKRGSERG